ncbi:hypothetical protein ACERIT_13810 [Halopenitus sp. H-Gu1]|uniref:hypothetical protein n=1 Tax=Halopenitus sp. H-Gu1 TaxID=3242697 RepID=UPI00359DA579
MGRRTALTSGAAIAFGSIAGCLGGDEEGWLVFTADADTTVDDVESDWIVMTSARRGSSPSLTSLGQREFDLIQTQ